MINKLYDRAYVDLAVPTVKDKGQKKDQFSSWMLPKTKESVGL